MNTRLQHVYHVTAYFPSCSQFGRATCLLLAVFYGISPALLEALSLRDLGAPCFFVCDVPSSPDNLGRQKAAHKTACDSSQQIFCFLINAVVCPVESVL